MKPFPSLQKHLQLLIFLGLLCDIGWSQEQIFVVERTAPKLDYDKQEKRLYVKEYKRDSVTIYMNNGIVVMAENTVMEKTWVLNEELDREEETRVTDCFVFRKGGDRLAAFRNGDLNAPEMIDLDSFMKRSWVFSNIRDELFTGNMVQHLKTGADAAGNETRDYSITSKEDTAFKGRVKLVLMKDSFPGLSYRLAPEYEAKTGLRVFKMEITTLQYWSEKNQTLIEEASIQYELKHPGSNGIMDILRPYLDAALPLLK